PGLPGAEHLERGLVEDDVAGPPTVQAVAADAAVEALAGSRHGVHVGPQEPGLDHGAGVAVGAGPQEAGGDSDGGGAVEERVALPEHEALRRVALAGTHGNLRVV